jgi:hypothetical protein
MASTIITFVRGATAEIVNPLIVNFSVGGTATFGTDYTVIGASAFTSTTGSVLIPANQTQTTITLSSVADTLLESNETVILTLLPIANISSGNSSVTWTILDDDAPTYTSILFHFDGLNESTSGSGLVNNGFGNSATLSFSTNATISTTKSKFGGSSLKLFQGATATINGIAGDLGLGSGDFTIEMFADVNSGINQLFTNFSGAIATTTLTIRPESFQFSYNNNTTVNVLMTGSGVAGAGTFKHLALTRQGGTLRSFVDGVLYDTKTIPTNAVASTSSSTARINGTSFSSTPSHDLYMDEFRITYGIAYYTTNFTPTTTPFIN